MKFFISMILTFISLNSIAIDKKDIQTLKNLVEVHSVSYSKTSPDGQHIAYLKSVPRTAYKDEDGTGYSELYVSNTKGDIKPFITGKVSISQIKWSSDSSYIYYAAKRNKDKFKKIYRISVDGGESEEVVSFDNNISSFSLHTNLEKLVFLAKEKKNKDIKEVSKKGFNAKVYEENLKNTHAYVIDLKDKKSKPKKININKNILSVSYHPSKSLLLVRVTETPLIDHSYMLSENHIYNEKGKLIRKFKTEGKLSNAKWSPNGKYIAFVGSQDIHDPKEGILKTAQVSNGKITNVFKKEYLGHISMFSWQSNDKLTYLGNKGEETEVGVINIKNSENKILDSFGGGIVHNFHHDPKGKVLSAVVSKSTHPKELYLIGNKKLTRLTKHNQEYLKQVTIPKQEAIRYKARDGVEIGGVLVYPKNYKKGKRYPLIMLVHGGPESHVPNGWVNRYSHPAIYAASKGFAIFYPNYRGSTARGVDFSKLGQNDYAGAEFDDLVDAKQHLVDIGLVDKDRVGITGGSYGGFASAWGATALTEHFAASVMFVGISDHISKFGTTDIPKEMNLVHARSYPWDKWQWYLERSPIYHSANTKTPILIMHGEKDTRVHPSQSMELYRYLKTHGKVPVRLVTYPNEPHGNKRAAAQLDYSIRLIRWMSFYLQGKKKQGMAIPDNKIDYKKLLGEEKK